MQRVLMAVVGVLMCVEPVWAVRPGRCCAPRRCQPAACQPAACRPCAKACYVDPCYCLKEEIDSYPIGGGDYESLYLGERHDDGCPPQGACQSPAAVYMVDAPNQTEQDCKSGGCHARAGKSGKGLAAPIEADFEPTFVRDLGTIARIVDSHFVEFDSPTQGVVRAKVFLVWLPEDADIRPEKRARMIAFGYEVKSVEESKPAYKVERRRVEQSKRDECLFYVDTDYVTYGVVTAK